jgi:phosphoglycerate dehydrogenase-like enzyme
LANVTLSPHLGYVNEENYRTFYRDTVENVAAWMAGKPIRILQP